MRHYLIVLCLLLCAACVQMKNNTNIQDQLAAELGKNPQNLPNSTGSFTLFMSTDTLSEADKVVKLMVVENKAEKIVLQEALPNAKLSWYSDTELLVEQRLGILPQNSSSNGMNRFLLNVENGKRSPLPQDENLQH